MTWPGQERFRKAVLDARSDGMTMEDIADDVPVARASVYRMMDDRFDFKPYPAVRDACERFSDRRLGPSLARRSNGDPDD